MTSRFSAPPQEKAPKDTYFYQDNKQLYCTFIGTQPPTMYKAVKETQTPRVAIQYDALFLEDQFLKPYYETDTQMVVLQHPQVGEYDYYVLNNRQHTKQEMFPSQATLLTKLQSF